MVRTSSIDFATNSSSAVSSEGVLRHLVEAARAHQQGVAEHVIGRRGVGAAGQQIPAPPDAGCAVEGRSTVANTRGRRAIDRRMRATMPTLTDYGRSLVAVTDVLRQLIVSPDAEATARPPDAARSGVTGASVNVFLYRDTLVSYRNGGDPVGVRYVAADLRYFVSCHAADDADVGSASLIPYGDAQAAVAANPVLTVGVAGMRMPVQVTVSEIAPDELAALWVASGAPMRLSFGVRANFAIETRSRPDTVRDVVANAQIYPRAGQLVVFTGTDTAAQAEAAEAVARELAKPIVRIALDRIVSKYIDETEHNLQLLFDRAETVCAVLLIDEADALFGQRTGIREAHDNYAGVETAHLLDVLATAPGIVIVAVAVADPRDSELLRRATATVHFPDE